MNGMKKIGEGVGLAAEAAFKAKDAKRKLEQECKSERSYRQTVNRSEALPVTSIEPESNSGEPRWKDWRNWITAVANVFDSSRAVAHGNIICPYCREEIHPLASICPYCRSELE